MTLKGLNRKSEFFGAGFAGDVRADHVVRVALLGANGKVGSRVLALIEAQSPDLRERGISLSLTTLVNSRSFTHLASGTSPAEALQHLREAHPSTEPLQALALSGADRADVLLDCTASADVAALYPKWLAAGIAIVTPNKHAASADRPLLQAIAAASATGGAGLFDSTAVGAQLPLTAVLRDLRRAGDRIDRIDAVLSGTLSFVLSRIHQGVALSTAVSEAVREGYAEPHPARDLSGQDAVRKLLILLRAAGHDLQMRDVECVPLVDVDLLDATDARALLRNLAQADAIWRSREALASARGERWIYRATFHNGVARVAPERVAGTHALAQLAPVENCLVLHSGLYDRVPLTISGPGAGVALTAAGVYADLFCAAERVAARPLSLRGIRDAGAVPERSAA